MATFNPSDEGQVMLTEPLSITDLIGTAVFAAAIVALIYARIYVAPEDRE